MYVISSGSLYSDFYFKQTTKIEKAKNKINFTQSSSPLSPADSHLKLRSLKNQGKEINEKKKEEKIKQNIYIWNRTKRKSEFLYPCKCPLKNQTGHPILQRPLALKQRMDRQNDEQRVTKKNEEGWESGWISISLS